MICIISHTQNIQLHFRSFKHPTMYKIHTEYTITFPSVQNSPNSFFKHGRFWWLVLLCLFLWQYWYIAFLHTFSKNLRAHKGGACCWEGDWKGSGAKENRAHLPVASYGWTRRGGSGRTTLNIPEKEILPQRSFGPKVQKYVHKYSEIHRKSIIWALRWNAGHVYKCVFNFLEMAYTNLFSSIRKSSPTFYPQIANNIIYGSHNLIFFHVLMLSWFMF